MKGKWRIKIAVVLLVLLSLGLLIFMCLLRKPYVLLKVNGKTTAVVREWPILPLLTESSSDIYAGKTNIFSLREDRFDCPEFIYPFPDGKRFLCDYDDDTAMLDFVVDFRVSDTNKLSSSPWPLNGELGAYILQRATNIVYNTQGSVRLPDVAELQEVSEYLEGTSSRPVKPGYLRLMYFWPKECLLLDLATNRWSYWPTNQ